MKRKVTIDEAADIIEVLVLQVEYLRGYLTKKNLLFTTPSTEACVKRGERFLEAVERARPQE